MKAEDFRGQVLQDVMQQQIDLTDKKILLLLSKNCRISNTAIGRHLRLTREVVAYRIQQLIKRGIITGFFTLIDQRKLGFEVFKVFVKLTNITKENSMTTNLLSKEEVTSLSLCSGSYDLYFGVTTRTVDEFELFMNSFLLSYASNIHNYTILTFLQEDAMGNNFILDETDLNGSKVSIVREKGSAFLESFNSRTADKKQKLLDTKDRQILKYVLFNARASLKEIAEHIDMTPSAVKAKMEQLIQAGTIKQFTPLISFAPLGYQWFMVFLQLVGMNSQKLYSYMEAHPNVEWCMRSIGPWNYQISIFARNSKEFHAILNQLREEFKENIIFFDSILVFDQLKFGCRVA
ncbi:Lrp/AsnC family transcriptional regulator [Candidatus Woesearchaeota archaeon]|nr:Lrp/AsnC family transcriptional regulator [Candidatus Woesearchaeota archaeon]